MRHLAVRHMAVAEGMRIAEIFFAKRKNPTEVHVDTVTFAGMLAIAFELGYETGKGAVYAAALKGDGNKEMAGNHATPSGGSGGKKSGI